MNNRYYSFTDFSKKYFGEKVYKISLNTNLGCPNRDGTISTGGCVFCHEGSGDFSDIYYGQKLDSSFYYGKYGKDAKFIGYFQAYTNTYAKVDKLRYLFESTLKDDLFCGIAIATRPDCMGKEVINLLKELKDKYNKVMWIELGLQTIDENTAKLINRGYPNDVFEKCVKELNEINIPVVVHIIIGLMNETDDLLIEEMKYLNNLHVAGVKLQLLHILKETKLYDLYENKQIIPLTKEEYIYKVAKRVAYTS